jgi:hypothetical protein
MAPLPVVASTLRVACIHVDDNDLNLISRFFITYTGSAPSTGQLDTFCTAVGTAWGSDLKSLTGTAVELTTVEAVDLTSSTSASGVASPAIAGTRSGNAIPADNCALTSYEINRRYRGGHPRGYWPFGIQTDLLNTQEWSSTFTGLVLTGIENFFSGIIASGWSGAGTLTHTNASLFEGFSVEISPSTGRARNVPTKRATAVVDPVLSYVVRARIASQRRRLGKA